MKKPLPSEPLSASESGNALVELALSLPLFLILMLGTAEIANLAWASVQVNNAARAAAAYASQSRANAASFNNGTIPNNILIAAQNEAPGLAITVPTVIEVCSCVNDGVPADIDSGCTHTTLATCGAPGVIQVAVQVNTQATITPIVHYPGLPATYTLNARATMGVAQ